MEVFEKLDEIFCKEANDRDLTFTEIMFIRYLIERKFARTEDQAFIDYRVDEKLEQFKLEISKLILASKQGNEMYK